MPRWMPFPVVIVTPRTSRKEWSETAERRRPLNFAKGTLQSRTTLDHFAVVAPKPRANAGCLGARSLRSNCLRRELGLTQNGPIEECSPNVHCGPAGGWSWGGWGVWGCVVDYKNERDFCNRPSGKSACTSVTCPSMKDAWRANSRTASRPGS